MITKASTRVRGLVCDTSGKLQGVVLEDADSGESERVAVDGIFVYMGQEPNTEMFSGVVELDEEGYILANERMETNVPGVYAAGDVVRKKLRPEIKTTDESELVDAEYQDDAISTTTEEDEAETEKESPFKQRIKGRISASSYNTFSDYKNSHRMQYAFSFQGRNIKNTGFSLDSYISFRHTMANGRM